MTPIGFRGKGSLLTRSTRPTVTSTTNALRTHALTTAAGRWFSGVVSGDAESVNVYTRRTTAGSEASSHVDQGVSVTA